MTSFFVSVIARSVATTRRAEAVGEGGSNPASHFDKLKVPSLSWGWIATPAFGEPFRQAQGPELVVGLAMTEKV
ncbi:MAG: hypothetical protein ABI273_10300 [Lacunisphaera sp.]